MSVALSATAKMVLEYVVSGLTHKLNMYMAYNDVLGQHQMVDRDGLVTVLWTVGAQYVWDKLRANLTTASVTSPPAVSLFTRSGTLWNLVDVATLTGVGGSAGTVHLAQQCTWVVRDTTHKFIRFVLLETVQPYVLHSATGVVGNPDGQGVSDMLSGVDANANAPYRWLKSRGDHFLAPTGVIAGFTCDSNDKLRRARGLV